MSEKSFNMLQICRGLMFTVVNYIWQNFSRLFVMETYLNTDTVLKNYTPPPFHIFTRQNNTQITKYLVFVAFAYELNAGIFPRIFPSYSTECGIQRAFGRTTDKIYTPKKLNYIFKVVSQVSKRFLSIKEKIKWLSTRFSYPFSHLWVSGADRSECFSWIIAGPYGRK